MKNQSKETTPQENASQFVPLMLRLPPDLHQWVKEKAEADTRSLNSQLVAILKKAKQCDSAHAN